MRRGEEGGAEGSDDSALPTVAGRAARDVEVLPEHRKIFGERVHGALRHKSVAGPRDPVAAVDEDGPDVGFGGLKYMKTRRENKIKSGMTSDCPQKNKSTNLAIGIHLARMGTQ